MLIMRLLFVLSVLGIRISANESISLPTPIEPEKHQQAFLFGELGLSPDVGTLYRNKEQNHGYDIYSNSIAIFNGGELVGTYNFYAPTKFIQPYVGMGAGVGLTRLDQGSNPCGVVPVILGLNSKYFFTDVGVSTYLGPHSENPPNPILFVRPHARAGLGFQF